jgi:hypothetical protein
VSVRRPWSTSAAIIALAPIMTPGGVRPDVRAVIDDAAIFAAQPVQVKTVRMSPRPKIVTDDYMRADNHLGVADAAGSKHGISCGFPVNS